MWQRRTFFRVLLMMGFLFGITRTAGPAIASSDTGPEMPTCIEESDSDGDGWGWENEESCRMPEANPDGPTPDGLGQPEYLEELRSGLVEAIELTEERRLAQELEQEREALVCATLGVVPDAGQLGPQISCSVRPEVRAERDKILAVLERNGRDSTRADGLMQRKDQVSIANDLADGLGSRPDLVNFMLDRSSGNFRILRMNGNGQARCRVGTYIGRADGHILLKPGSSKFTRLHEAAHILDCEGGRGRVDGIPTGISSAQKQTLINERTRITVEYRKDSANVAPFRPYSFEKNKEFWADASGFFLAGTFTRNQMAETAPELHDMLRDYYGRDDLPDAASVELTTVTVGFG